jgi:hypothetical protein
MAKGVKKESDKKLSGFWFNLFPKGCVGFGSTFSQKVAKGCVGFGSTFSQKVAKGCVGFGSTFSQKVAKGC